MSDSSSARRRGAALGTGGARALVSVRIALPMAAAVMIGALAPAGPAAADAAVQPVAASLYTVSAGRVGASLSTLVGLLGSVAGGLALARTVRRGRLVGWARRNGAATALVTGPVAVVGGAAVAAVAATAEGGLGTGNGLGGACVAVLMGLLALTPGGLARARTRGTR